MVKGKKVIVQQGGAFYGLGMIGALVYYLQHAGNVVDILLAFVKAIIWPALVSYHLLKFLGI